MDAEVLGYRTVYVVDGFVAYLYTHKWHFNRTRRCQT